MKTLREFYESEVEQKKVNKSTTKKKPRVCAETECPNKAKVGSRCQKHYKIRLERGIVDPEVRIKEEDKYDSDGNRLCLRCRYYLSVDKFSTQTGGRLYPRCMRCVSLYNNYGLDRRKYDELLKGQNGVCAICSNPPTSSMGFHVDHDHSCCGINGTRSCGKCVRGLLCGNCNTGLGCLKDSKDNLLSAVEYIKKWEGS